MELDQPMSENGKHVLLREDLEPAFDEAAGLAAMETMADEAGDWRGHVPYAAARRYRDDPELQALYGPHVDECAYCRQMIDALHPAKEVVDSFRALVQEMRVHDSESERMQKRLVEHLSTRRWGGVLPSAFLLNPDCLQAWESTEDVASKFKAARIYLGISQLSLAYERIGEGCALAKVDGEVVERVAAVAQSWHVMTSSVTERAQELMALLKRDRLDDESDQLRLFGVLAELGQHDIALESLHSVLMRRDGTDEVVEALETAELVAEPDAGEAFRSWLSRIPEEMTAK